MIMTYQFWQVSYVQNKNTIDAVGVEFIKISILFTPFTSLSLTKTSPVILSYSHKLVSA